jgi:hypothetical protein
MLGLDKRVECLGFLGHERLPPLLACVEDYLRRQTGCSTSPNEELERLRQLLVSAVTHSMGFSWGYSSYASQEEVPARHGL